MSRTNSVYDLNEFNGNQDVFAGVCKMGKNQTHWSWRPSYFSGFPQIQKMSCSQHYGQCELEK